jgi:hypothetical protein
MMEIRKVFRVFDGQPTLLHRNACGRGEPSRRATEWCVESGAIHCRLRDIGLFVPQLRAFFGLLRIY